MSTSTQSARSVQLPSARTLVGVVYVGCVLTTLAVFTGAIIFSDKDPQRSEGPVESLITVGTVGTAALVIGVGLTLWLVQTPERARIGTYTLVALAMVTIVFFWSGAPGIFGACAAWCAGLTKGGRPLTGSARTAGIIGAFIAGLNVVLSLGGWLLTLTGVS